jgi:hypothetical protein
MGRFKVPLTATVTLQGRSTGSLSETNLQRSLARHPVQSECPKTRSYNACVGKETLRGSLNGWLILSRLAIMQISASVHSYIASSLGIGCMSLDQILNGHHAYGFMVPMHHHHALHLSSKIQD